MIGHRQYLDNPRLFRTLAHKPPIARGHRRFLALAAAARSGETGATPARSEGPQSGPQGQRPDTIVEQVKRERGVA